MNLYFGEKCFTPMKGMISRISIGLLAALLLACSNVKKIEPQRYLALGDSYTIGESVAKQERWPVQLADTLTALGIPFTSPRIIARTGWTTDELQTALTTSDINDPYDWVSLLIGVNNQYRGRPVSTYLPEFRALLEQAIQWAGNRPERVFVVSIPDWGAMPFAEGRDRQQIAQQIDDYNRAAQQLTERLNVHWVDITPLSRQVDQHPEWVAADGLHPSGAQYTAWVTSIFPWIQTSFND